MEGAPEEAPRMFHKLMITDIGKLKNDTNKDKHTTEGKNEHRSHFIKEQGRHR